MFTIEDDFVLSGRCLAKVRVNQALKALRNVSIPAQIFKCLREFVAFIQEGDHRQALVKRCHQHARLCGPKKICPCWWHIFQFIHAHDRIGKVGRRRRCRAEIDFPFRMIGNHCCQQVLFKAAKHMHARHRIRCKDIIQISFLTSIGVVPDNKLRIRFVQPIGHAFLQQFIKQQRPARRPEAIHFCQQFAQARFCQGRSGQQIAMPIDDRFQS